MSADINLKRQRRRGGLLMESNNEYSRPKFTPWELSQKISGVSNTTVLRWIATENPAFRLPGVTTG